MSGWTADELSTIARVDELEVASRRPDGSLRPFVTIWFTVSGDDLYIRSAHGPQNGWFRRATESGTGRVRIRSVEKDVVFEDGADAPHAALDAALHAKYDRYGPGPVGAIVGPDAAEVTLRVVPTH
ncbi:DUF2255 family protein [Cellulomonas sp. Root137]|uniref:DUF2255 family protein n=1 Tax=Cellulomonas sp. Root137 TaxID=1736459 RepID=UPI0006F2A5A0|nr:DUF2255 family protein [Cellulomonas sp. Root137]KQY47600.1 hypothetical protein ASD18_09905 [Cellulomonas sp. Root137]